MPVPTSQAQRCCNDFYDDAVVIKEMELKPNVGSDRSWVYTAHDYSEGEPTTELLAVRFANKENAETFKEKFTNAQQINEKEEETKEKSKGTDGNTDDKSATGQGETMKGEKEENNNKNKNKNENENERGDKE